MLFSSQLVPASGCHGNSDSLSSMYYHHLWVKRMCFSLGASHNHISNRMKLVCPRSLQFCLNNCYFAWSSPEISASVNWNPAAGRKTFFMHFSFLTKKHNDPKSMFCLSLCIFQINAWGVFLFIYANVPFIYNKHFRRAVRWQVTLSTEQGCQIENN